MYIKCSDKICDISGGVLTLINPKRKEDDTPEEVASKKSPCMLAFIKGKVTERIRNYPSKEEGQAVIDKVAVAIQNGEKILTID